MSVFEPSKTYVPIYPEFVALTVRHEQAHWGEWEAKLQQDVEQYKRGEITEQEKYFVNSILRLFTESDKAVAGDYYDNLIPVIRNNEARNMLGSFAGREGTHQRAYALLNDTLGFGEGFYSEFLQFGPMIEKLEFMVDVRNTSPELIAESIAKQVLVEGVCLFASFAMLLNFTRFGKLMGMGDVNLWSIKDESMHVEGLSLLFRQVVKENPKIVNDAFKKRIYSTARQCAQIEDRFIDLAFDKGGVGDLTAGQMKQYIRSVCDYRMVQLGFKPEYNVDNPLDWLEWVTSNTMQENFFETNTVGYSKNNMTGEYANGY